MRNELPSHGQEVLISVHGVNYISTFDADKRIFRTTELMETFFRAEQTEVLWKERQTPAAIPTALQDRKTIFTGQGEKCQEKKRD